MRKVPGLARLADRPGDGGIMQPAARLDGLEHAASRGEDAVVPSERGRDVVTGEAFGGPPDHRIALVEYLPGLLLHRRVREELVDPVRAGPDIHDQEFP